jgi:hypothetical protein
MYLSPSLHRDKPTVLLYLGFPTLAGILAGYVLGHRAIAARTALRAVIVGLFVAVLAFGVFSVLYVLTYNFLSPGSQEPIAFLLSVFIGGLVATGPLILPIGGLAGWILFSLRYRIFERRWHS